MITAASILACRSNHSRAACGLKQTVKSCNRPSETSAAKRIDERHEQSARLSLDIDGATVAIDEPREPKDPQRTPKRSLGASSRARCS